MTLRAGAKLGKLSVEMAAAVVPPPARDFFLGKSAHDYVPSAIAALDCSGLNARHPV